jgi:hypothetical protein
MVRTWDEIRNAETELEKIEEIKVNKVANAFKDYVSEFSKTDDDDNLIGNPRQVKSDWGASLAEEGMDADEFDRIFSLIEVASLGSSMAYC